MKISVIITTYNRPDMLAKVLDGMCNQTRMPDEVIIADDGSGDETRALVNAYTSRSRFDIYHVRQEDKGFRAARIRNKSILRSTGQYIIFLDGDCIPEKHFIQDHLALAEIGHFFQGKRILIGKRIHHHFSYRDAVMPGKMIRYLLAQDISNGHHLLRLTSFPPLYTTCLGGIRSCNMGVFRGDIFAVNGFNQDFVGWGREDSEFAMRLYKYGLKRKEHPFMAICFHLWHAHNDTNYLSKNDAILRKTLKENRYFCEKGLTSSLIG